MNAQIKELRIGNYIHQRDVDIYMDHYTYDGQLTEICIDADSFKEILEEYDEYDELPSYIGIPISEEWLERWGFDEDDYFTYVLYTPDSKSISLIHFDGTNFYARRRGGSDFRLPPMEYVHIFQNLIYFLTGTELTLK